ncbi:DUF262 domain-containing protein, partial [Romboutsia sp.]|uniref:DUF262 domain-containing protein n=1 Tax=Romboutsia sp. TaxID=1965302 RepID=UPI003F404615
EDLYFAFENKVDSEYFLGSLVLKRTKNKEYAEYEVLDGQQRLTTFFMILATIRDLLDLKEHKETINKMIYQEKNELLNIPARERITYQIRDKVEGFIERFIVSEGGTLNTEELEVLSQSENISISNMSEGLIVIKDILKDNNDLSRFTTFILNKALFIYVSTDNTEDAFRMFTILNDRGIPLTSADILKSINVGAIKGKKELKKYSKIWEDIESKYGDEFDRFLMLVRNIIVKQKANSNLLDEFERNIYEKNRLEKGIQTIDLLSKYDEIYEDIIDIGNKKLSNQYKNLITIMKVGIPSQDWIPPLMCYYEKFNTYKLDEFLTKLEYKFSGDWINQETPTKRIDNMNKIMKAIDSTRRDDLDEFTDSGVFEIDTDIYRKIVSGDIYKRKFSKYLLLKIEYLMTDDTVYLSGYKTISVEHILPQNPKEGSKWIEDFSNVERKFWINKVANLVLISKKKNSRLSNLDYAEKKKRYLEDRVDAFKANKMFLDFNSVWTPEVLGNRQDNLVEMLAENSKVKIAELNY